MNRREFIGGAAALATVAAPDVLKAAEPVKPVTFPYKPGVTGKYDVYLRWEHCGDATEDARFWVKHAGGECGYTMCQRYRYPRHFLGTFDLNADSEITMSAGSTSRGKLMPTEVICEPVKKRTLWRVGTEGIYPATLNVGDEVIFHTMRGPGHSLELVSTFAEVCKRDEKTNNILAYRWGAEFLFDKQPFKIERVTPSDEDSFALPFEKGGMVIWLDAVQAIFADCGGFMTEKDYNTTGISCRPKRAARIVLRDECTPFAPEPIRPWFPGSERPHPIKICFQGTDTWMGTWQAHDTHGGLDINMPSGSILTCPMDVDDQYYFAARRWGDNNNRWKGVRFWKQSNEWWWIYSNHINRLLVDEHTPLKAGTPYADAAGTWCWEHEHVHFNFRVFRGQNGDHMEDFWLDPWIFMRAGKPFDPVSKGE